MTISWALKRVTEILALAFLIGCGGGEEGDGSTPLTPLTYVGNTNPAFVTTSNAGAITANILSTSETSENLSTTSNLAATQLSGVLNIGRHMHRSMRATVTRNRVFRIGEATPLITVDDRVLCDSGDVRVVGAVGDNGTGTVSIEYNACRTGDTTTNGSATLRIDAFEHAPVPNVNFVGPIDYTITFNRLTLTGVLIASLSGSIRTYLNIPTRTETIIENTVVLFGNGAMAKTQDLMYVDAYADLSYPPKLSHESVSGRVFHSGHGWIEISTVQPLNFDALKHEFPSSGVLVFNGAGSAIRLSARSRTLVDVGLDLDGDAVFERSVLLAWTELDGPIGADLGDTDGDGMHNGWEVAHGLNPNDAFDATADADGDGASNWQEYDGLADPRNASSVPASVGLSIQAASPDSSSVGALVEYTLRVSTSGPLAKNVVLSNSPPASANFVAASPGQGSCAGTGPVVCTLGTVGSQPVSVRIIVSPIIEGIITNTATVSTASYDPVVSDNSVTSFTTVGPPAPDPPWDPCEGSCGM